MNARLLQTTLWVLGFGLVGDGKAQEFQLHSGTVAIGGGRSGGGGFQLSGAIGRADSGPRLTGEAFRLRGGFFAQIVVLQTPGAPTLAWQRSGNNVRFRWLRGASGFVLENTGALGPAAQWSTVTTTPNTVGDEYEVEQSLSSGIRFYRLRRP